MHALRDCCSPSTAALSPGRACARSDRAPFCHAMGLASWKYQPDYHSVLNMVHALLHNAPMEIQQTADGTWETVAPLRWLIAFACLASGLPH